MKLWRVQYGIISNAEQFSVDKSGACGPGIYAMLAGDKRLQKYYKLPGHYTYEFEITDSLIKKVGGKGLTTFQAIAEHISFISQTCKERAFICKHGGINVPKSKQVVIIDPCIITDLKRID